MQSVLWFAFAVGAAISPSSSQAAQSAVDRHDSSQAARSAVDGHDSSQAAQSAVDRHDSSQAAQSAVDRHDLSQAAQSAVDRHDSSQAARSAVDGHDSSQAAQSAVDRHDTIKVTNAWARPTAPGAKMASVYLTIENSGKADDALLATLTNQAKSTMLHASSTDAAGTARMRHLPNGVALPAKKTVLFAPGGTHIMLMGLMARLQLEDSFKLKLIFERAKAIEVTVMIKGHL